MRTMVRLLATSTVFFAITATAASAGTPGLAAGAPQAPAATAGSPLALARSEVAAQTLLVQLVTVPWAGKQTTRYQVFQRVQPLVIATGAGASGSQAIVSTGDVNQICDQLARDGWEQICELTVVQNPGAHAAAPAPVAVATAASAAQSESAPPLALAIAHLRANPVSGRALVVDVALPAAGPARLDLLDVMGRLISERDLSSMGAGRHEVNLSEERRFAPGVYLLRLTQGADAKVARVTVID